MAIGSGLGGYIGVGKETTYGTFATATRFPEVHSSKIVRKPHTVQGTGLAAGRIVDPASRYANTWWDGNGPIDFEWLSTGMGLLLNAIMGSSAVPTQLLTTAAYQLVSTLGAPDGSSLSIQEAVPDTTGTLHPYTALGCVPTDAEWTSERGGLLTCQVTMDAQDVSEVPAIATPTFTTGATGFHGDQCTIAVGPKGSEVSVDGVKKFTLKIARKLDTTRIYMGSSLKEAPVTDGIVKITGSFDVDLVNTTVKAAFADMFASQDFFSLIATWTGPQIGTSGHDNSFALASPSIVLTGATPDLSGPGVVTGSFPFEVLLDSGGDSALTATWVSGDTAL